MKERIKYFDLLRGLAIIGVVAIHSSGIGYTFPVDSVDFNFTVIWRQLINFAVPMFLSISGFFLVNKNIETQNEYILFLKKQIPRVLIPYVIWSFLYLSISYIRGISLFVLIYKFFTFQTAGPFYFVILIIEYYILLPVLQKFATIKGLIYSSIISLCSCSFIFYLRYYMKISLPLYIYGSAPSWLFFYILGMFIRKNGVKLKNVTIIIFVLVGFGLSLIETFVVYYKFHSIGDSVTAIKISSFVYSSFVILLAFKNYNRKFNKIPTSILTYLGQISYGIFLSHMFFMSTFNFLIKIFIPKLNNNAIIKQLLLLLCVLLSCSIFAVLSRKIDKKKAIQYLGQ